MEFESIETQAPKDPELDPEAMNSDLCCPLCDAAWLEVRDGEGEFVCGCTHLLFAWVQDVDPGDIELFNGFKLETLVDAAWIAYKKVYGPDEHGMEDDEINDREAILNEIMFDEDVWKIMEIQGLDVIMDHTEQGMACGPTSFTVLYGMTKSGV